MALQGSLTDLKLGDVLQTILGSSGKGLIVVRGPGQRAVLHLGADGLRIVEPEVIDEKLVIEGFVRRGSLSAPVARRARETQGGSLDSLVAVGTLDAAAVNRVLREAAEEAILEVLGWQQGTFRFEEGAEPDRALGPVARICLDPGGLLLRAAQRIDELKGVHDALGPSAVLLAAIDGTTDEAKAVGEVAACVHAHLDGRTLLDEIAVGEGINRFEVLKAGAALVEAGAARIPPPEELRMLAESREASGDVRSALALLRQWQAMRPLEPEACLETAVVAARAGRFEDEADALKGAGRVALKIQDAAQAKAIFERLLVKRPGDADSLEGLRQAARLLGDAAGFSGTTRSLAERALEAGDAGHASAILHELITAFPEDVPARLLRTKALSRLGDRAQAIEELERLADLLPTPCRKRADREAAAYVRDTLPHLAPDQTDLLRRFREKLGNRDGSRRRVAILSAFLLACSGVGFAFWPKSAQTLLTRAQAAATQGDNATALALIAELSERFPDADETTSASLLKARLEGSAAPTTAPKTDPSAAVSITAKANAVAKSLARFPTGAALDDVDALCELLRTPEGSTVRMRRLVTEAIRAPLAEAVAALRREALERRDVLDSAADVAAKPPTDLEAFRATVERAEQALDAGFAEQATKAAEAARRLAGLLLEDSFAPGFAADLRALDTDVRAATRAVLSRAGDVHKVRVEFHRGLLGAAYERSRIEAAKLLARGDLDGAQAIYGRLAALVAEVHATPVLEPLVSHVDRRGIEEFSRTKTEMMGAIRRGIAAAQAAEEAGNLEGAATTYASLVNQFPVVRFDEVFTIPMRVESTPPGARVFVNRKEAGLAPLIVRYGWGSQTVVTIQAEGYDTASIVVKTSELRPEANVRVALTPAIRWARALAGVVEAEPLGVDGDVVVCTRSGRVERLSRHTGDVVWSADLKSLEGTRSRPTADRGLLYVPLLDGKVARLALADGSVRPPLLIRSRPIGDAASLSGHVAIAVDDTVALFADDETPTYVKLAATASAGVLASHGAFWVGDVRGGVTRIDTSGRPKTFETGSKEPVVGLAGGKDLVYALTGDGTLVAVEGSGLTPVRWRRADIGDTVGRPAEAAEIVAVADHAGRVSFFSTLDGSPKGREDAGSEPRGGLRSIGARIAATLVDGRIWFYDPAKGAVVVDSHLDGTARIPLAVTGDGSVVAPAAGNGLVAFPVPK